MRVPVKTGLDLIPIFTYGNEESYKNFKKIVQKKQVMVNGQAQMQNNMFIFQGNFDLTPHLEDVSTGFV
eukprot:CAMPEP_0170564206 /NCGR_PEP_ID=MMETSP0211-20121228/71560_1 /TAXON_ID=311385 /ORGANISM="Pseudokeronopsis sp., Strain OXSARD2" /LENGTH=68 /DNA_ID=CAMNT_0010883381 /DNA_START=100 /DNA_END=306 /DNA_ORIENTATION=+